MKIALTHLVPDPKNPNACSSDILDKLKRNIERTGFYPALVVRQHPKKANHYLLIDGHHRKLVLEALGYTHAECQVVEVNEKEAKLLLATLNRLHGTDNLQKRAELIESLMDVVPIDELALMIPESKAQIEDLLALLRFDLDQAEKAFRAEIEKELKTLPVAFSFLVEAHEAEFVHQALALFEANDRGQSLVALSQYALIQKEGADNGGPS
ncbi:MAG: plasmid partitioning protein RepB [Vampirovibrio sp.]|jgi:ParB-like chromosome segregation protein Spo0J|nr:plasmid partitioning protein RepB [Vampirovibrio sp.]